MKKFIFIMPLMAVSLLASCGGDKPKPTHKTYIVTTEESDHLNFTTLDGSSLNNTKVYENEDFKFKMNVDNPTLFIVPTKIDIKINDMDPLVDGYEIKNISETEAEVTVFANKIIGNIVISGEAASNGYYQYEVPYAYGLDEIAPGLHKKDEGDLYLTFTPKEKENNNETYSYPDAENIYIQFDNCPVGEKKQWVSPAETFETIDEYCSYNNLTGELTIKSNHIKTNIIIIARANDYPLLDKLSWGNINKISFSGAAKYVFYIGEEKTVEVNELSHKVRIIGFNHDYSELPDEGEPDPNKALGITFEFANIITDSNGAVGTIWDATNNYDYRKSTLNNFLNNDVLNMLPSDPVNIDLREVIKQVDKKVGVSTDEGQNFTAISFDGAEYPYPYLFPLAHDEIISNENQVTEGEGFKYQYYIEHNKMLDRIKNIVNGSGKKYQLRSPLAIDTSYAYCVGEDGFIECYEVSAHALGVAPAFCI